MKRALLFLLLTACDRELVVLAPTTGPSDAATADGGADGAPDGATLPARRRESIRGVSAFAHTCAIDERGVACWGEAEGGQFGTFGGLAELEPRRIALGDFTEVCNGENHACALRDDGSLLCWGANGAGQLAVSDRAPRARPVQVPNLRFSTVACGGNVTCGVTLAAELYCWGENLEGTLGQGEGLYQRDSDVPLPVAPELRVKSVSVGQAHACLIDQNNKLYCWGRNTHAQSSGQSSSVQVRTPALVEPLRSYERVAAAQFHTCAIADGKLYCWGMSERFAPSDQPSSVAASPMQIGGDSDWRELAANWFHNCAIKRGGALYCWGRNDEHQIAQSDKLARREPTRVMLESSLSAVAVGHFHTCAIDGIGLLCWGDNRRAQLGIGVSSSDEHVGIEPVALGDASGP